MRKKKYYNNGIENRMIKIGDPIPDGFVPGMCPRSIDDVKLSNEKRKQTNLKKYGVSVPLQSKEIREKTKHTCIERYGVENPSQAEEIKEKRKETNLEKYGVEYASQAEEIKDRMKQTNLKRYGVENPFQSEEIKERIKKSNLETLGVPYPMMSKEVQEKSKQTCIENYGTSTPMESEIVQDRAKHTCIEKYGVEYPMQSEDIQEKSKQTLFKNYGVTQPMDSDIIKKRVQDTNIEKYGVPYTFQDDKTKEKISNTCFEKYGVNWACMRPEARKSSNDSAPNRMFSKLLDDNNIEYEREFTIEKYSYDFKVGNILLEINPTVTHNTLWSPFGNNKGISISYHRDKLLKAEEYGYRCIHIFDWDDVNKVINLLKPRERVYARSCEIRDVGIKDCNLFLSKHHLQGTCRGQEVRLGLYYDNELISVMTFGKPRYNKNYEWELLRFSSCKLVLGGEDRLFKRFLKEYNPKSIISYCDRAKFKGTIYEMLGFNRKDSTSISKHWYSTKEKRHITDNLLRQRGYDQLFNESVGKGYDNESLIIERGYLPVYDCGQVVWIYVK